MLVETDKVVTFHYRLSEPGQEVFEDPRHGQPVVYLHGHQGLLQGLEDALTGKKTGDTLEVTLSPEGAYGARRDDAQQRVSIKHVYNPSHKKIIYKPGMVVQLNTKNGRQSVVVIKAGLKSLDVDINHPLAGKTLVFSVEVMDVRTATADEIAHGHAHGVGGHHH